MSSKSSRSKDAIKDPPEGEPYDKTLGNSAGYHDVMSKLSVSIDSLNKMKTSGPSSSKQPKKEPRGQKRLRWDESPPGNRKKRRLSEEKPWRKLRKVLEKKDKKPTCKRPNSQNDRCASPKAEPLPSNSENVTSGDQDLNQSRSYPDNRDKTLDWLDKFGRNFYYCPSSQKKRTGLRPIYIDGSNVAYGHGQNELFSVQGLKICIDYFRKRGHDVKAFVPQFRLRKGETTDHKLLHSLVQQKLVVVTPTLSIHNQLRSPYDDWYIVQSAAATGGIIVSADNFKDILQWNPNLRSVVEERRLVPTFVDDMLIFPVDPHGNRKNNLDQFLKF